MTGPRAGATCLLCCCLGAGGPAAPADGRIGLTIVPHDYDAHDGEYLRLGAPGAHFHVVLSNRSRHPIRLWRDNVSLGYDNLRFEVTADGAAPVLVVKNARPWEKNLPAWFTVPSGRGLVFDVTFAPPVWRDPPLPAAGQSRTLRVRAIYRIEPSAATEKYRIWSGTASSGWADYTLSR
jgi:hypothetical protein